MALELTDNIPVGTYVLLSPLEGPQRFTFLSKRWLEMTRLDLPPRMTPVFKSGFCPPTDQPCAVAEA